MRFTRYLAFGFQIVILAFAFTRGASADLLHFHLTGTYKSPDGIYPLTSPDFDVNFNLPSDPANTISGFQLVELYTTASYINAGAELPYGLALDFGYGGLPQLYSNTAAAPHFSPDIIDFGSARDRYADQGAGYPMVRRVERSSDNH